jgi:hypothetical protein
LGRHPTVERLSCCGLLAQHMRRHKARGLDDLRGPATRSRLVAEGVPIRATRTKGTSSGPRWHLRYANATVLHQTHRRRSASGCHHVNRMRAGHPVVKHVNCVASGFVPRLRFVLTVELRCSARGFVVVFGLTPGTEFAVVTSVLPHCTCGGGVCV